MLSIVRELESTPTARWYQAVQTAQRAASPGERAEHWPAVSPVLDGHAAMRMPEGDGQGPIQPRSIVAEAKVSGFWPYRQGVMRIGDALNMPPFEWAAAYLRALAAWAGDNRRLAACHSLDPPDCVAEDMSVLAAGRRRRADKAAVARRAARLTELARTVIAIVLDDAGLTPLGAFSSVRDEVHQLLVGPTASLAYRVVHSGATARADHRGRRNDSRSYCAECRLRQG